jgi:CheY-like chemotaxis protein
MFEQSFDDPHRDKRGVLLIAGESSLRFLLSTFLSTMRCACMRVSNLQQLARVQNQRLDAVLIDIVNPGMAAEQAIVTLRELHPELAERIMAFSSGATNPEMLELIERYGLHQMSRENLLAQVWATLQDFITDSTPSKPAQRGIEVAQLTLDSFRIPLPAGARGSHGSGRQLAYRHKNITIDVLLTPEVESGRVLLAGQVMGFGMGKRKNDGLAVLLTDGVKTIARTATNQFGEFQLEFESIEDPGLQIRLREGCWAAIALGKMDWAKKPPLD